MKTFFRVLLTALALTACIVALGAVATLLYDAAAGLRGDFGIFGMLMLAGLLVGQCRILWILLHPDPEPESNATPAQTAATTPVPYRRAEASAQARPR